MKLRINDSYHNSMDARRNSYSFKTCVVNSTLSEVGSPTFTRLLGERARKVLTKASRALRYSLTTIRAKQKRVIVQVKSGHVKSGDKVSEMLQAFRCFIGENQMMAVR